MSDTTTAEVKAEETITELEKFDAERVDGVANPANGFPVLLMKALPEAPPPLPTAPLAPPATTGADPIDVAELAKAVAAELAKATVNQVVADEPKKGHSKKAGRDKELIESLVSDAVTKATEGAKAEIESLRAELAKVKAQPIPGGPVMSIAVPPKAQQDDERTAKAEYYRAMARTVTDPGAADSYRQLARQIEEQAPTTD